MQEDPSGSYGQETMKWIRKNKRRFEKSDVDPSIIEHLNYYYMSGRSLTGYMSLFNCSILELPLELYQTYCIISSAAADVQELRMMVESQRR